MKLYNFSGEFNKIDLIRVLWPTKTSTESTVGNTPPGQKARNGTPQRPFHFHVLSTPRFYDLKLIRSCCICVIHGPICEGICRRIFIGCSATFISLSVHSVCEQPTPQQIPHLIIFEHQTKSRRNGWDPGTPACYPRWRRKLPAVYAM